MSMPEGFIARRRSWSLSERQGIVDEAIGSGVSVSSVARRHGVNANLVFKWIKRSREGWFDGRRASNRKERLHASQPKTDGPAFASVKVLGLDSSPGQSSPLPVSGVSGLVCEHRSHSLRGVIEIRLPNGAYVSFDAGIDTETLRRILSVFGIF
jgi:transposase